MARSLQTIYEYFKDYTKEQVNLMLEKLSEEERKLLTLRYGEDLDNPVVGKLNKEEMNKFYGCLLPKMKKLLANPNKEIKPSPKRNSTKNSNTNRLVEEQVLPAEPKELEVAKEPTNAETKEIKTTLDQKINPESITKKDYFQLLELLAQPSFTALTNTHSPKEALIVALKLGYIDGKCFSTSAISNFLQIEEQEIINITKKVLLVYKERINQIIDNTIETLTNELDTTTSSKIKTLSKQTD